MGKQTLNRNLAIFIIQLVLEVVDNKSQEKINARKTNGQKHTVCFEINPVL